ncbi:MAG: preprotein translocase subunit SecE [Clostridia bacterium]|nr:preprotein translocase subunit SecE [Clostridia bacterium]
MAKKEISEAAQKVAAAEKSKQKKPANPNGNWFVRAGKAIKKFFKDLKGEIKKIVWPDGKTVLKSTLVVIFTVAVIGLAIFAVDWLLTNGLQLLKDAAKNAADGSAETTAAAVEATVAGVINSVGNWVIS